MVAMRPIAASPVAANAQPSRPVRVSTSASISAIAVSTAGIVVGRIARSLLSWATRTVHAATPMPRMMAGTASRCLVCGRPVAEVSCRAQGQVGRAVQGEDRHDREPGSHGVGAEQVDDSAGEHVRGVERHSLDEVGECDAPEEGGTEAADRVCPQPCPAPPRALLLCYATRTRPRARSAARGSGAARRRTPRTWLRTRQGMPRRWLRRRPPATPRCRPTPARSTRT